MDAIIKLREWLKAQHYGGVILSRRDNFAWITGGKRNQVLQNTEIGIASLVIKPDCIDLIADNIDAKRICEEEIGLEVNNVSYPWYEARDEFVKQYIGSCHIVSDTGIAATQNVQEQLTPLRMELSPNEVNDYKNLGNLCAELVEKYVELLSLGRQKWKLQIG